MANPKHLQILMQGVEAWHAWHDLFFILVAPVAAWWMLDINLFPQAGSVDPWFYTGVGQIFNSLVDVYGWPYYLVRFPITFVNRLCCRNAYPDVGYILLRYLLVVGAGGSLYSMALKKMGRPAAMIGYLYLFCNPLFLRVIAWDLTPFLSVPAALAGAAIWLHSEKEAMWRYPLAGGLFCISVNSHIFTSTAIACFLMAAIIAHLLSKRPIRDLAVALLGMLVGFAAVGALGWWYYYELVGPIDPLLFWKVNRAVLAAGSDYALTHARPFWTWAAQETYFYVPYLWIAAALILRRGLVEKKTYWTILLASILYGAFYLLYRFMLGRFVIEAHYYFGHIWAVCYLLVPLVAAQAAQQTNLSYWIVLVFMLISLPADWLVGMHNRGQIEWLTRAWGVYGAVAVALLAAVAGIACLRLFKSHRGVAIASLGLFCATLQFLSILPHASREVYGIPPQAHRRDLYMVGIQHAKLWATYARKEQIPLLWYQSAPDDLDISSVVFTTFGDALHNKWQHGGMPNIGEYERQRLAEPGKCYLFLLAKNPDDIQQGKKALAAAGLESTTLEQTVLASGSLKIFAEIVQYINLRVRTP
jgi:hypothetical protein